MFACIMSHDTIAHSKQKERWKDKEKMWCEQYLAPEYGERLTTLIFFMRPVYVIIVVIAVDPVTTHNVK